VDDPEVGSVLQCASPIRSGSGGRPAGPAPRLGADTAAVLCGVLGRSKDEVADLRRDGVCP
ncbi:MAG: 2-methylfumaryl-CoA isomerase, partial [Alphaproteobacteria bacterium]